MDNYHIACKTTGDRDFTAKYYDTSKNRFHSHPVDGAHSPTCAAFAVPSDVLANHYAIGFFVSLYNNDSDNVVYAEWIGAERKWLVGTVEDGIGNVTIRYYKLDNTLIETDTSNTGFALCYAVEIPASVRLYDDVGYFVRVEDSNGDTIRVETMHPVIASSGGGDGATVSQVEDLLDMHRTEVLADVQQMVTNEGVNIIDNVESAVSEAEENLACGCAIKPATESVLLLRRLLALTEGSTEPGTVGTVDNRSVAVISESGEKLQDIKVENETRTPTMHIAIDRTGDIPTHMKSSNIGIDGLEEATVASVITDAEVVLLEGPELPSELPSELPPELPPRGES